MKPLRLHSRETARDVPVALQSDLRDIAGFDHIGSVEIRPPTPPESSR